MCSEYSFYFGEGFVTCPIGDNAGWREKRLIMHNEINLFKKNLNEKYDFFSALDFIYCNGAFLAAALNLYYYNRETEEEFLHKTCEIFDRRTMTIKGEVKKLCNNILKEIKDHYDREEYSIKRVEAIIKLARENNKNIKNQFMV